MTTFSRDPEDSGSATDEHVAESALEEALEALAELAQTDPGAALEMFATLPEEVQGLPQFQFEKSLVLREVGDLAAARSVLEGLLSRDPEDSDAHHLLADVLEDLEEPDLALSHFLRTLELDRADSEAEGFGPDWEQSIERLWPDVLSRLPAHLQSAFPGLAPQFTSLPTREQVEQGLDPRTRCLLSIADASPPEGARLLVFVGNLGPGIDSEEIEELLARLLECVSEELEAALAGS